MACKMADFSEPELKKQLLQLSIEYVTTGMHLAGLTIRQVHWYWEGISISSVPPEESKGYDLKKRTSSNFVNLPCRAYYEALWCYDNIEINSWKLLFTGRKCHPVSFYCRKCPVSENVIESRCHPVHDLKQVWVSAGMKFFTEIVSKCAKKENS